MQTLTPRWPRSRLKWRPWGTIPGLKICIGHGSIPSSRSLLLKGGAYPPFMQTQAWTRKDLQTSLGSWTELKHDTILYAKQVMAEMGGGLPVNRLMATWSPIRKPMPACWL